MRVASMIALVIGSLGVALATSSLTSCSSKAPSPAGPTPIAPVAGSAGSGTTTATTPTGTSMGTPTPTSIGTPTPSGSTPNTPIAPSSSSAVKVTLADVGLEAASLDRTMDPCVDFYQFACGGWIQANPIPASYSAWARFVEVDDRNKAALKLILEDAAKGIGVDAPTKKIGDFYAACMDEAAIEKAGTSSIKGLVEKVKNVKDARSWLTAVVELHKIGENVVWSSTTDADSKQSTTYVTIMDADGLGLPDRDYYVKPELKDKLDGYTTHVAKMLGLAGVAKPELAAADVVALETELAKLTKTAIEARDSNAAYNPTDAKGLAKQVKSVDWGAYWKGLNVTPGAKLVIGTPKYFAALDGLRAKVKPAAWSAYFTYHLVKHAAFSLPKAFDDEAFALTKLVTGQQQKRDRDKRCISEAAGALGEVIGQHYVAKQFPGSSKQTATTLVDAIVKAMNDEIASLDWMSEATKPVAQAKLAKIVRRVGYPDKWRTYEFEVKRDDFAGDVLRASAFEVRRKMVRAGKPVDRGDWDINAFKVDAYYNASANNTAIPAGILQPPFFGQDRAIAANLGGIGMVIGHELTHGFDDDGSQFDGDGNLKNWWSKDDRTKFDDRASCVADQYSTFEPAPKQFIQGRLTLGENIADMGGVKMAFKAYRALRKDAAKAYLADGFTEDQQFFIAMGQAWCANVRPEQTQQWLTRDPHSPPKFRVYGSLRNLREFADAFSCPAGTPMRPAKTCSVW